MPTPIRPHDIDTRDTYEFNPTETGIDIKKSEQKVASLVKNLQATLGNIESLGKQIQETGTHAQKEEAHKIYKRLKDQISLISHTKNEELKNLEKRCDSLFPAPTAENHPNTPHPADPKKT